MKKEDFIVIEKPCGKLIENPETKELSIQAEKSVYIAIKNGLRFNDGTSVDIYVNCLDQNNKSVDFKTKEQAQNYFDKNFDNLELKTINKIKCFVVKDKEKYIQDNKIAEKIIEDTDSLLKDNSTNSSYNEQTQTKSL